MQVSYDDVKAALLRAGTELRVPIPVMIDIPDQNSRIRRIARQMVKAMQYLSELYSVAEVSVSAAPEHVAQAERVAAQTVP